VSRPSSVGWFARHEARLAWRDWVALVTAGSRRRAIVVVAVFALVGVALHWVAWLLLRDSAQPGAAIQRSLLVPVTGALLMAASLMLSQAMEAVTRVFYARGDLELVLCSPADAARLFAVRVAGTAMIVLAMMLVPAMPLVHVLAWLGGVRWLFAYAVLALLAMLAVAVALAIVLVLFRAIGARRARLAAQVVAAVVGAALAIAVQFGAIAAYVDSPRLALSAFDALDRLGPPDGSIFWWPARALLGEPLALLGLLAVAAAVFGLAMRVAAPRFATLAVAAGSVPHAATTTTGRAARLRGRSAAQVLRRKEWTLLWRDPWLLSQTLMQLLYLAPAGYLLWRSLYAGGSPSALVVPILIVAAGQLAGGLAWLAVSGEDAPELIASAPVSAGEVLRAKAAAVLGLIVLLFGPLALLLALVAPLAGAVALAGALVSAAAAGAIQFRFRTQARRSHFRRRQTSSRVATYAEALSSIMWAATGALAANASLLAVVPGVIAMLVLGGAWAIGGAGPNGSRRSRRRTARAGPIAR